jgi:hypothetical protein
MSTIAQPILPMVRLMPAGALVIGSAMVVLLGGCLDGLPANDSPPAGEPAAGGMPVVFDECFGWSFIADLPWKLVQDRLPPEYETSHVPTAVQGMPTESPPALAVVVEQIMRCEQVSWPGGAQADVVMGLTLTPLRMAGGNEFEGYDTYVFEVFFDRDAVPALDAFFDAVQWPVHDADIEFDDESFHITADGLDYAGRNAPSALRDTGDPFREPSNERYHFVGERPSYGTLGDTEMRGWPAWGASLSFDGGFFGSLGTGERSTAPLVGQSQGYGLDGPAALEWAEG